MAPNDNHLPSRGHSDTPGFSAAAPRCSPWRIASNRLDARRLSPERRLHPIEFSPLNSRGGVARRPVAGGPARWLAGGMQSTDQGLAVADRAAAPSAPI